jgi:hypothetical protein
MVAERSGLIPPSTFNLFGFISACQFFWITFATSF